MRLKRPEALLTTKERKALWRSVQPRLRAMCATLKPSAIYVFGSFASAKRRPADIDLAVVVRMRTGQKACPLDIVLVPAGKRGDVIVKDMRLWMQQKYGKRHGMVRVR